MPLHDVSVEASVHHHGALHIDLVALSEQREVGAVESLLHGRDGVGAVGNGHHGEAHAIVSNALINLQLIYKRATQGEIHVALPFLHGDNRRHLFYYSTKHNPYKL